MPVMGATNNRTETTVNLGDKLKSFIEPALTDLGTKIPGWGWVIGAYESIKEWFQAGSDYQKANDPNIGPEAQKEYKLAADGHSNLAGKEAISTVLAQTGFKQASWGVDLAGMTDRMTNNPVEHEQKAQKLTFDDIKKEAANHLTSRSGPEFRNTP